MKKLILFILLVPVLALKSQTVIPFGQRLPELYYWDTNWYDHVLPDYSSDSVAYPYKLVFNFNGNDRQAICYARYFWTDEPLRVIGAAAPVKCDDTLHSELTSYSDRMPEYFRLYDATDTGYSLMGEVSWEDTLRYRMCLRHYEGLDTFDVREGYFKSPVTVTDSFYVGGTTWNTQHRLNYEQGSYNYHRFAPTQYLFFLPWPFDGSTDHYWADATPVMWKYVSPLGFSDMPNMAMYDTTVWVHPLDQIPFMAIFPILDLAEPADTCATPSGLHLLSQDSTSVTLAWTAPDSGLWEFSYVALSSEGDSGTTVICSTNFAVIDGLDTGCYVARVRTVCNDTLRSEWSDTTSFCIMQDTTSGGGTVDPPDSTGISTAAERFTMLMPNPAHNKVTVFSSFKIEKIQVYSATGTLVGEQMAKSLTATIDLTDYPRGAYILRIVTSGGTIARRLIVN